MGNGRNQRLLPLLYAANSVNYGKPFKMNTAEATAACLYIVGYRRDAEVLLSSFSYGPEFIRMNKDALDVYSACSDSVGVAAASQGYISREAAYKKEKEEKRATLAEKGGGGLGGYMDDIDLPPMSDEEYDDEGVDQLLR